MFPETRKQTFGDVRSHLSSANKSPCGSEQTSPALRDSVSPVVFKIVSSFAVLKHKGLRASQRGGYRARAEASGGGFWEMRLG